mmetsp:Transcript_8360/g.32977  ORF Transcript_8360/g.32977 Transcript_8360/m.32977 type:complete len:220 (-) Transcript_8360:1050-1709(-)
MTPRMRLAECVVPNLSTTLLSDCWATSEAPSVSRPERSSLSTLTLSAMAQSARMGSLSPSITSNRPTHPGGSSLPRCMSRSRELSGTSPMVVKVQRLVTPDRVSRLLAARASAVVAVTKCIVVFERATSACRARSLRSGRTLSMAPSGPMMGAEKWERFRSSSLTTSATLVPMSCSLETLMRTPGATSTVAEPSLASRAWARMLSTAASALRSAALASE